jgi:hypothetical protein
VPLVPSDEPPIDLDPVTGAQTTSILLLRVGEGEQGVVGCTRACIFAQTVAPAFFQRLSCRSTCSIPPATSS